MDLTESLEEHVAEWTRLHATVPGVEVHDDDDAVWKIAPGVVWGNVAARLRFRAGTAEARIDRIVRRFRENGRGGGFWVSQLAEPGDLASRLARRGFRCRKRFPGMVHALAKISRRTPAPRGLTISAVEDHDGLRAMHPSWGPITTAIRRFELMRLEHLVGLRPKRVWDLVAMLNGAPVGACTLVAGRVVAGLWDVAVVEAARNQGIGTALVAAACRAASDAGLRGAVLIASGMGEGIYRQVGFEEVCRLGYHYAALK